MNRAQILKSIFFLNAFLAFFVFAFAQAGFKLDVSSRSIGRDEVLQVSYTVTNASQLDSRISVTSFPGWKIVSGPQTSQETSIINGVTSSSIGYIYLLMPQKTGNLAIPGASVTADGKKLTCAGVTVHVSNQSTGGGAPAQSSSQSSLQSLLDQLEHQNDVESSNTLHQGESATQKIKDNMFVRATPSKRSVYVGEPFSVTYQLYSALGGQSKVTKQPSFNGVSVVEVNKEDSGPEIVTIGNKKYRAFLIRKVQLTALQPGPISLGIMETSNEVPFASYDDPYHPKTYVELVQNQAVTIDAKPLPEGRPSEFSGAIGHFTIRVIPQTQSVPVGENDMLNVEIIGEGNLINATMPKYDWPSGIEHYDAKDSQHVDKNVYPFRVSKVFKIPFIGDKVGKSTFAPISFSYFDPETGKYSTVQSDPFTVEFTPALPKEKSLGNAFGLDLSGDIAYWAIGAVVLLLLLILIISSAKRNKKKVQKEKIENKKQADADKFAPWNVDANKKSQSEKQEVKQEDKPKVTPVEEPTKEAIPTKEDYSLEMQSIMLSTNKTEMYEKGNNLICRILAQYLHSPIEDKYALLEKLKNSEVVPNTKDKIVSVVNNLNNQINRGLYSPLFSEEDKLNLVDGLNDLLKISGLI